MIMCRKTMTTITTTITMISMTLIETVEEKYKFASFAHVKQ